MSRCKAARQGIWGSAWGWDLVQCHRQPHMHPEAHRPHLHQRPAWLPGASNAQVGCSASRVAVHAVLVRTGSSRLTLEGCCRGSAQQRGQPGAWVLHAQRATIRTADGTHVRGMLLPARPPGCLRPVVTQSGTSPRKWHCSRIPQHRPQDASRYTAARLSPLPAGRR